MADAILKAISIKQRIVNVKKHLPVLLLTSKTLYCHQYSADFTYFVPLARELFLHYWLTFRENGPRMPNISLSFNMHKLFWGFDLWITPKEFLIIFLIIKGIT